VRALLQIFLIRCLTLAIGVAAAAERPNFIWIVGEDMGPELRCYGDAQAHTPNLDRLAREGVRFTRAFTHAPVCAPSRSGLITGMYPVTIGTHHMRSQLPAPPETFTSILRKAGYYVAWPGKTDFNFTVPTNAFDSMKNWTTNLPKQPFFAYINFADSHESQIRAESARFAQLTAKLKPGERHDPAKMQPPPYHPDTTEVRRDLANYYDLVTAVDYKVGELLNQIERQGLATNTVIFFFGDHGRGLPRSKRWIYDSGIHVPLIVRWPGQIKPGTVREDLVSFIDFAPTVLSLAQAEIPARFQGQVFLGARAALERKYIFAARDRMDEAPDRIRCVREKRFKYIRNFHPEWPYAQKIAYMEMMPTMQAWRRLNAEGSLTGAQRIFFAATKPKEELYDLDADPHEIDNLIDARKHREKLDELRAALDQWLKQTQDLGEIPERELIKRGLVADKLAEYEERKKPGYKSP